MSPTIFVASTEDHELTTKRIREVWPGATEELRLELHLLRRYEMTKNVKEKDVILLCHYFDGRTLLTDNDGLYNTFLVEAVAATGGYVFVALTGVPADDRLARLDLINQLTHDGQTSISELHRQKRFFTWDSFPSKAQVNIIVSAAKDEKEQCPLQLPISIKEHAAAYRQNGSAHSRKKLASANGIANHNRTAWRCSLL
uniref:Uncharacterized protein n=1 Tax=Aureoumbra lagunensis TaxID=44058 RepID=A0A7S3JRP1_9STRA